MTKKIENTVQQVIGLGLLSTAFSVFDCGEYIERKLLAFATHPRLSQGKEWEVIYLHVSDGREQTCSRSFCTDISWSLMCAREMCEAVPGCTRASLVHILVKEEEWKVKKNNSEKL